MSLQAKYGINTDPASLDIGLIHQFLTNSYWAKDIPREVVEKSIENSVCFGAFDENGNQVGFARAVTDKATFAYLGDVFVLEEHRGRGISKMLMEAYLSHPDLQGLRRQMLATSDAHELYKKYGFGPITQPEILMQKHNPEVYKK